MGYIEKKSVMALSEELDVTRGTINHARTHPFTLTTTGPIKVHVHDHGKEKDGYELTGPVNDPQPM